MDALTGMWELQRSQLEAAYSVRRGVEAERKFDRLLDQAMEMAGQDEEPAQGAAKTAAIPGAKPAAKAEPVPGANLSSDEHTAAAKPANKPVNPQLMDVCYQMEALFIGQMLDAMRETVHESEFFGKSMAKDIFSDMLYDEYAKLMARTDQVGLARHIYNQIRD